MALILHLCIVMKIYLQRTITNMKTKQILTMAFLLIAVIGYGQDYGKLSFTSKFGPNIGIAHVTNNNTYPPDGITVMEGTSGGSNLSAGIEYAFTPSFSLCTGIWATDKSIFIRNSVQGYSGVSTYDILYMQIPILLKFYTKELFPKFKLYFTGGGTFDLRLDERVGGDKQDHAHFKNLANNDYYTDPTRGANGNGTPVNLFAPGDITLYLGFGAQYQLFERLALTAGFSYNQGFVNMINPNLLYNNADRTPVHTNVNITNTVIGLDIGVKYTVNARR